MTATVREWISGIDVSSAQGLVDFRRVHASGQRFAIVKATEGSTYISPGFFSRWDRLADLDGAMYRGAYHFCRPDTVGGSQDGRSEARHLCRTLDEAGRVGRGCFPPALDFEKSSPFRASTDIEYMRALVNDVADHFGRMPMIYTGMNVWKSEMANTDEFVRCPLWLVRYTKKPAPTKAMASLPWSDFTIWQWSGGGKVALGPRVPGVNTVVDLNRFNGTETQLAALAGIGGEVTSPC